MREMTLKTSVVFFLLAMLPTLSLAQTPRDEKVRNDKKTVSADERWIYNDPDKATGQAKAENKPILLVFRCIPCEACSKFDEQMVQRDPRIAALMDQFICVRVPQANGMDLSRFQFDYDMSLAVFFLHADGTILGRYATRTGRDNEDQDMNIAGFARAMEKTLELYKNYDKIKPSLAGKQSLPVKVATPEQFPTLKPKFTDKLDYDGAVAKSCIHCHNIREAERSYARANGQPLDEQLLYPYPAPNVVGLIFDPVECATLKAVLPGSDARTAGLKAKDKLLSINNQPLVSIADVQWVLHQARNSDTLQVRYERDGKTEEAKLVLQPDWRKASEISWRATTWDLRRQAFGGMLLENLSAEEREKRNLPLDQMALLVKHVGQFGEHARAKQAGFLKDDVIVDWSGQNDKKSETELIAWILNEQKPGGKIPVEILRSGKKQTLHLQQ